DVRISTSASGAPTAASATSPTTMTAIAMNGMVMGSEQCVSTVVAQIAGRQGSGHVLVWPDDMSRFLLDRPRPARGVARVYDRAHADLPRSRGDHPAPP